MRFRLIYCLPLIFLATANYSTTLDLNNGNTICSIKILNRMGNSMGTVPACRGMNIQYSDPKGAVTVGGEAFGEKRFNCVLSEKFNKAVNVRAIVKVKVPQEPVYCEVNSKFLK